MARKKKLAAPSHLLNDYEKADVNWDEVVRLIKEDLAWNDALRAQFVVWYKRRLAESENDRETA